MAPPNKSTEKEDSGDDVVGGTLYRESHLREAEAAAVESKMTTASTHHRRTSTRKNNQAVTQDNASTVHKSPKRKRASLTEDGGQIRKRVVRDGRHRPMCSADGCTNFVVKGGVCCRHGAKVEYKLCSNEGCTNKIVSGGVCKRHGAKMKRCRIEGCTNQVIKGGVCVRHGANPAKRKCSSDGCKNQVWKGGVCVRHGAKRKRVVEKDAKMVLSQEECARGMGQSATYAAVKDAPIGLR